MPAKKKKLCFVLMPFKDEMKEVYWKAIKPACDNAGFTSLRMDELFAQGSYNINKKIIHYIFVSDAIVADLTSWNPNVFYELGIAHTISNKTIMIIQKKDKPPFDVGSYHCIQYEQTESGLESLTEIINQNLRRLSDWCQEPTNPVQEFKPYEALVPRSELKELEKQLQEKEKNILLQKKKLNTLENDLSQTNQELEQRPQQTEILNLKKENEQLRSQLLEKKDVEKKLRTELHKIRVKQDEADRKKSAEPKIITPPLGMVLIPAGEFIMGTSEEKIEKLLKDHPNWDWLKLEKPAHKVWLDAFLMDQYLVTNAQYAEFLNDWGKETDEAGQQMIYEHGRGVQKRKDRWEAQKGFDKHPVVNVTWYGAQQYAHWAKKQLPSEAQWEKAARGGKGLEYGTSDGTLSTRLANYADSKIGKTTPVGNYPPNPYGLYDMSGNVWEWCQDWFDENYYQTSPAKNPIGPETGDRRVLRGGSWNDLDYYLPCSIRYGDGPGNRLNDFGFRVACGA